MLHFVTQPAAGVFLVGKQLSIQHLCSITVGQSVQASCTTSTLRVLKSLVVAQTAAHIVRCLFDVLCVGPEAEYPCVAERQGCAGAVAHWVRQDAGLPGSHGAQPGGRTATHHTG